MPSKTKPLAVSKSSIDDFRRCEQLYDYRYVQRLRSRDRAVAPERGVMLHKYLEHYYRALQDELAQYEPTPTIVEEEIRKLHEEAKKAVRAEFAPSNRRYMQLAREAGAVDLYKELKDLPDAVDRICDRYFKTRGLSDAAEYEVLHVEERVEIEVTDSGSIVSNGRVDLITRHRKTGIISMWEHKSTKDIPDTQHRLRDLQLPLYERKLQAMGFPKIDSCIWNYIRTKEPTVPERTYVGKKNEGLTKRVDLDSTWEVFLAQIEEFGYDVADYSEQQARLEGREETIFFMRQELPIIADGDRLFLDFKRTALDLKRKRQMWEQDIAVPVRNIRNECNWCEYVKLCNAVILTGDDSDIRRSNFQVST